MASCTGCSKELDPTWKLCPFCGTAAPACCASCGKPMDPTWKLCPFCGTEATNTRPDPPSQEARQDRGWGAWSACEAAVVPVLREHLPLLLGGEEAGSLGELLHRCSPEVFEDCAEAAMDAMLASLPPGGADLSSQRPSLTARLRPRVRAIRHAARALEPHAKEQGWLDSFLAGAAAANNPTTMAGIGGAVGTLIAPGLGTAVGAMAGQWWAQSRQDAEGQGLCEAWDSACQAWFDELDQCLYSLWDVSVEGRAGFQPAQAYEHAQASWASLQEPELETIRAWLTQHGPWHQAVHAQAQLLLRAGRLTEATEIARELVRGQPSNPEAHELLASSLLYGGQLLEALDSARAALADQPLHIGLLVVGLEAAVASDRPPGDFDQSLASLGVSKGLRRLLQARGFVHAGKTKHAIKTLRSLESMGDKLDLVRVIEDDDLLAPLLGPSQLVASPDDRARRLVREHLVADGERFFFELPPGAMRAEAKAWLRLKAGEELLWMYDWTMFNSGAGGIAISTRRLIWKGMFSEPESKALHQLDPRKLSADGNELRAGRAVIDVEVEGLAPALVQALRGLIPMVEKPRRERARLGPPSASGRRLRIPRLCPFCHTETKGSIDTSPRGRARCTACGYEHPLAD